MDECVGECVNECVGECIGESVAGVSVVRRITAHAKRAIFNYRINIHCNLRHLTNII